MQYTQEMILRSDSGYCMPYEEKGRDVQMSLATVNRNIRIQGNLFFTSGVDFKANHYLLSAVATGKITGFGNDAVHGIYQVTRYGDYEVKYAHLSNVFSNYGSEVKAGQVIAVSGEILHMEVKYKGEELNPLEFLTMIYSNLKVMEQNGQPGAVPQFVTLDMDVRTMYDKDSKEIENLMMRFFPDYMKDISLGAYTLPEHTQFTLRKYSLTVGYKKNYFYENHPQYGQSIRYGRTKVYRLQNGYRNLLIGDFLNYLALRHQIFLSSLKCSRKKKKRNKNWP